MGKISYTIEQSKASHDWVIRQDIEDYGTYEMPVGMIKPSITGFIASGVYEEKLVDTKEQAKDYIVDQFENW